MDTGIRPGSMRKLKWKDSSKNTTIQKKERKIKSANKSLIWIGSS